MTVYSGTQQITMGRNGDPELDAKRRAAIAQSQTNPYIQGVQAALEDPGASISASRGQYGDTTVKPGDLFATNFSQGDSPGNSALTDLKNQSGSLDTEASATTVPDKDPEDFETRELNNRLRTMAGGRQGFPRTHELNNQVRSV